MKVLTKAPPGSPDWLAARKGRVTSTRASNIICGGMPGVTTFKSALEEFIDIKRELCGDEPEEEEVDDDRAARMKWGVRTEPMHLDMLREDTGWTFSAEPAVIADEEHDWLATSLDAFVTRDGDTGIAELKAPTSFQGLHKWDDGKMPLPYQVQLAVQLHVTRLKWGILSALIPPSIQWAPIEYDEKIEAWIMEELTRFWSNLQRDIPPPAQANERDIKALREMARPCSGKAIFFSQDAYAAKAKYEDGKRLIDEGEKLQNEAKVLLIQELGDAELGVFPDGSGTTFKPSVRNEQARPARVLTIPPSLRFVKSAL